MSDLITKIIESGKKYAEISGFVNKEFLQGINSASEAAIDSQDFGVIRLDDKGVIQLYNKYESELSNIPKENAVGKNFFYEVAPCTNNRLFLGAFQKMVEEKSGDLLFFYTFTYRMKPTNVRVYMHRKPGDTVNWIFIKKNS